MHPRIAHPMLLATDQHSSFLTRSQREAQYRFAYCAFGHAPAPAPNVLPAFNGQWAEPQTRVYLLGNGYRALNSVLMRFHSPDSLSPFGDGGLNTYVYCAGDPVNNIDPSGHIFKKLARRLGITSSKKANGATLKSVKSTTSRTPSVSSNVAPRAAEPISAAGSSALKPPARSPSPPPRIQDISAGTTVDIAPLPPSAEVSWITPKGNVRTRLTREEAAKSRARMDRATIDASASRTPVVSTGQGDGLNFPPGLRNLNTESFWVRNTKPNNPW